MAGLKPGGAFIVQEHHGKHLHWDFRLEAGGVLKSWAILKGPSLDPGLKRFAIQTPNHDLSYADFEGVVPESSYGSGTVLTWDEGRYYPLKPLDPIEGINQGSFIFRLNGLRLKGVFALIKLHGPRSEKDWLLVKKNDVFSQRGWKIPILLNLLEKEIIEADAA